MALFAQDSGGGAITPGGGQILQQFGGGVSGSAPAEQLDEWDRWQLHFAPPQIARPGPSSSARAAENYPNVVRGAVTAQNADRRRLMQYAKRIGIDTSNPGNVGKLWLDAIEEARGASLVSPTTPWQILEAWAGNPSGYSGAGAGGRKQGPRTITQTSKSVNLTDPKTARAIAKQALRAELQRDPTKAEFATFIAGLGAAEKASPTVTKTTSKFDAEGTQTSSSSTTSGGVNAQAFADDWMKRKDPEADAIRAGQEYFSAAQQLVGSIV